MMAFGFKEDYYPPINHLFIKVQVQLWQKKNTGYYFLFRVSFCFIGMYNKNEENPLVAYLNAALLFQYYSSGAFYHIFIEIPPNTII